MKIEKIYSRNRIKFNGFLNNKNDKKIAKKYSFLFNVVIIILTATITFRALLGAINPILNRLCMDEAKNIATKISNEQASLIMNKYKYEDIITIVRDDNGNIKMLQTNIKSVNELTSDIPNNIVSALKSEENSNISIYLGSILGLKILSAQGPKINVRIANVGNVETSLESQFVEQGINQTLHRIYLEIVCEVSILTPYDTISEKITNQVLIAESVIVGNVPDAYYNIQTNDSVGDSLTLVD